MLSKEDYLRYSLEVNLFFLRLAKEHAIFAAPALPPRDRNTSNQLVAMKNSFEGLLTTAVKLSNSIISPGVLASKELVTDLTLQSEAKTQFLTGIPIDMNITKMELALKPGNPGAPKPELIDQVAELNKQTILGAKAVIAFLEKLLTGVLSCKAASFIYPALIEHILEETRFFTKILASLESRKDAEEINKLLLSELQLNWNEIMKEHAMAIRGYLDLSEVTLFKTADAFVNEFDKLPPTTPTIDPQTAIESQRATSNLRNFKTSLNHGMLNCAVKSLQPPLFYDHVTREANHYLRLLKTLTKK